MFLWCVNFMAMICIVSVTSEGIKNNPRQGRIFSFQLENEDIEVALDFAIPFVKIPFKKTLSALTGFGLHEMNFPNINYNPMAIGLGGLIVVLTTFLAPLLTKIFGWHNLDKTSRVADDYFNRYIPFDISEKVFANSRRCPERIACWASQKSKRPEVVRIWKDIMSNQLLSAFVNTTVLEDAALNGLKGRSCESYTPCSIEERNFSKILKSLDVLTNRNISYL